MPAAALTSPPGIRAQAAALVVLAIALRVIDLGSIPGLNGDEAWYGVQAQRLCRGEGIAWRTPTGNPLNPFFFLPQLALAAWCSPSVAWLRLPAVASGLAALALNYWACQRAFDRTTARASTVALAVLPVNLAYSRFAWDACQSLLATLAMTYAALALVQARSGSRWVVISGVTLALACLVHPTNVFLAPLVVAAVAARFIGKDRAGVVPFVPPHPGVVRTIPGWLALVGGVGVVAAAWVSPGRVAEGFVRLCTPTAWSVFFARFVRLFTGVTTLEYIPGSLRSEIAGGPAPTWALAVCDLAGVLIVGWALVGAARRARAAPGSIDAVLAWGYLGSLAGFFFLAGPEALAPHFERYGLGLVGPGVLLFTRGILAWPPARVRPVPAVALLAGWLAVAAFWQHYLLVFRQTGLGSHPAFGVAVSSGTPDAPCYADPKQAAVEFIRQATPTGPVVIEAPSWWTSWPAAYFAGGDARFRVTGPAAIPDGGGERSRADFRSARRWRLEFVGETVPSPEQETATDRQRWSAAPVHWILGPGGQPVLAVRGPWGGEGPNPTGPSAE